MDAAPAVIAPAPPPARTRSALGRRAAVLRWPALGALVALAAVYPLTHDRSVELRVGGSASVIVSGGSIAVGYAQRAGGSFFNDAADSRSLGPFELRTAPWAVLDGGAWRPYHFGTSRHHHLAVPVWIPLTGAAFLAGLAFGLASRRPSPWACGACGYPLPKATPGAARVCPECGAKAP